jgi:hypothetical protein
VLIRCRHAGQLCTAAIIGAAPIGDGIAREPGELSTPPVMTGA